MNKYKTSFGVEIHFELLTKSKAFSDAKVDFSATPNTNVSPVDLGYPGAKPIVNKKMIEYAYRLARVLDMEIENKIYFDRKNYFYPDLPKGFQITQHFKPIGKNGKFKIFTKSGIKEISITEIHMEEDTAKQIKTNDGVLFDFNRSGIPLIEIVSDHKELSTIEEVISYVKLMRKQLIILGINDGKMEEGSFRVDVNVSIFPENKLGYGNRTEVKNLNSFKNIEKALNFEIDRHIKLYESNQEIKTITVRFDEETETTIPMREKNSNYDYNFIPEGNINPIILNKEIKKEFENISNQDIKIFEFYNNWVNKISKKEISIICSSKKIFDTFNKLIEVIPENDAINFIVNNIKSVINDSKLENYRLNVKEIKDLIKLRKDGKINNKETNELILKMFKTEIKNDIKLLNDKILLNNKDIKEILFLLLEKNSEMINKEKTNRPERVEKFLMGQILKETKGKANPKEVNDLIKKVLWKEQK